MGKILFHIAGIAILEIIFYFYYIGPMESQIFINSFKKSVGTILNYNNQNSLSTLYLNISEIILEQEDVSNYSEVLKKESDIQRDDRNNFNKHLLNLVLLYWSLSFVVIITIVVILFVLKKKYKTNQDRTIELVVYDVEDQNNETTNLIPKKNNCYSEFFFNLSKYILLGGLLLLFEYIFFKYVVLQYHVISEKEIEYIIYNQILSYAKNY